MRSDRFGGEDAALLAFFAFATGVYAIAAYYVPAARLSCILAAIVAASMTFLGIAVACIKAARPSPQTGKEPDGR